MPYKIQKKGSEWCVTNKQTGESKGCSESYEKAVAHMRVLYGVDKGWKPTKKSK